MRSPQIDLAAIDRGALTPEEREVLDGALDDIQLESKLWLLDELDRADALADATLAVLGGWCGVLPWLLQATGRPAPAFTLSIDIDPKACSIGARAIGRSVPSLSFLCADIHDVDYARLARPRRLVVVNTICEHLHDLARWRELIPAGTLLVLQSNNYRGCPDHVNCVDSAEELASDARLAEIAFVGDRELSLFTRYMVIGRT